MRERERVQKLINLYMDDRRSNEGQAAYDKAIELIRKHNFRLSEFNLDGRAIVPYQKPELAPVPIKPKKVKQKKVKVKKESRFKDNAIVVAKCTGILAKGLLVDIPLEVLNFVCSPSRTKDDDDYEIVEDKKKGRSISASSTYSTNVIGNNNVVHNHYHYHVHKE